MKSRTLAMLGVACLATSLSALGFAPSNAAAALELEPGGMTLELPNKDGEPETRAGAHPDRLVTSFEFAKSEPEENAKQLVVSLPPGLSGNPGAVPTCPRSDFAEFFTAEQKTCPPESQIGEVLMGFPTPLYNIEPAPGELAVFGARSFGVPVMVVATLEQNGQGLSLRIGDASPGSFRGGEVEIWGVPADHQGTGIPRRPLLTMPTRCDEPVRSVLRANTWQHPDVWMSNTSDYAHQLEDCASLAFDPRLEVELDRRRADAPSGVSVEVTVPQDDAPDGRATSMVRDTSIAMPAGMTISPGGAMGLEACTDAEFGLDSGEDASCPPASRIGAIEMALAGGTEPLAGSLFLGQEHPQDRFRILGVAGAAGSQVKLTGSLKIDARTGLATVDLRDLPQVAFERMTLRFNDGPRALLATPLGCGAAPTSARFTSYNAGRQAAWSGSVDVTPATGDTCGPAPFAPTLSGGGTSARPGGPTSFTTTVRRQDGEQLPRQLAIELPRGLSAALGTVERCPAEQAQAGSCPAASRVGTAVAELGPGGHPAPIDGEIFLTGPYRGAQFGVALAFDAAFGPFQLGTLAIRGALDVDLLSGQVEVRMDSLPTRFEGVPIRFQMIGLDLDRQGFMLNPTSCRPGRLAASLRSEDGAGATASVPFALRGCVELPFRPRFSAALGGSKQLRAGGKPSLRMSMRMRGRGANVHSVEVRLPSVLELDSSGLEELCSRHRALEGRCPRSARIGTARARTPLLREPMSGPLYLVQPGAVGKSPDIWASLEGQGLEMNLRAETAVQDGHTETRFLNLPDFPLESLALRLGAGDSGIFELKRRPCGRLFAPTRMTAQNGAETTLRTRVAVRSSCSGDG